MKKFYVLTFFFLSLFLQSPLMGQIANPSGELHPPSEEDIWAKTLEGSHYNEMWNYQFYLNDNITVHIAFSVANFGSFKDPVSGLQLSIQNLEGETYQVSREYPIEYLIQDPEQHLFKLRNNRTIYFQGELPKEHKVHVEFTKHDVFYKVELDFSSIQPGITWGDGLYHINDEDVGIITHIPYAEVEGTVQVDDVEKSVNGTAYMDHTFQDRAATDIMNSGYRFVYHENKDNWDLLYYLLPKDTANNESVGIRLQNQNGEFSYDGVDQITRMNSSTSLGVNVARLMDMKMQDGTMVRVSRTKDFEKFSILSELGWLAKKAAKSFLGGEVISLRGEAILMEHSNRPKRGYYNFYVID